MNLVFDLNRIPKLVGAWEVRLVEKRKIFGDAIRTVHILDLFRPAVTFVPVEILTRLFRNSDKTTM